MNKAKNNFPKGPPSSNTNNLINEAFNLNNNNLAVQPLVVLPPTTQNIFQSSHCRTPSTEIKKTLEITAAALSSPFNKSSSNSPSTQTLFSNANLTNSNSSQNLSSFFDNHNLGATINTGFTPVTTTPVSPTSHSVLSNSDALKPPPPLNSSNILTPIATKPVLTPASSVVSPPIQLPPITNNVASILGNLPPLPVSNLPPPSQIPPPSTSASASNPYSARGALNKKIYDTSIVLTAPITSNVSTFIQSPQSLGVSEKTSLTNTGALFKPPPLSTSISDNTPLSVLTPSESNASLTTLTGNTSFSLVSPLIAPTMNGYQQQISSPPQYVDPSK
jgi:hypothetical protein